MEKAFDFLSGHKDVAFATVEQDKPKIRVFQIMRQEGHTLYFATSPRKEVYRQLRENPHVELLAMDGDISVRLTGHAVFDVPDALAREIYADNPVLPRCISAIRIWSISACLSPSWIITTCRLHLPFLSITSLVNRSDASDAPVAASRRYAISSDELIPVCVGVHF